GHGATRPGDAAGRGHRRPLGRRGPPGRQAGLVRPASARPVTPDASGLAPPVPGEGREDRSRSRRRCAMTEPGTHDAGEGLSDEEMIQSVADQTDSASENADVAGKDWDGDPSAAPAPSSEG